MTDSPASAPAVTCTINDGVADVRLNRPQRRNALNAALAHGLIEASRRIDADRSVRAVVLSGEGKSFCAGLDMDSFKVMGGQADADDSLGSLTDVVPGRPTHVAQEAVQVWRELPVPVIAAVWGHALGGGLQIAMGADIRIVHPDTQLSMLEIRWGLVPDMTGTQYLPALVGPDRAMEMTLTGRMIGGVEAVQMGLCTRLADEPLTAAFELARAIATASPEAVRGAKRMLALAGRVPLADGFTEERVLMHSLIGSRNQVEAVRAAMDNRRAVFED